MELFWQIPLAIVWIAGWVFTIRLLKCVSPAFRFSKPGDCFGIFGDIALFGTTLCLIVLWPLALALIFLIGFYNWAVGENVL